MLDMLDILRIYVRIYCAHHRISAHVSGRPWGMCVHIGGLPHTGYARYTAYIHAYILRTSSHICACLRAAMGITHSLTWSTYRCSTTYLIYRMRIYCVYTYTTYICVYAYMQYMPRIYRMRICHTTYICVYTYATYICIRYILRICSICLYRKRVCHVYTCIYCVYTAYMPIPRISAYGIYCVYAHTTYICVYAYIVRSHIRYAYVVEPYHTCRAYIHTQLHSLLSTALHI